MAPMMMPPAATAAVSGTMAWQVSTQAATKRRGPMAVSRRNQLARITERAEPAAT